ncbi:MAG: hypothetical protein Q9172_006128 [Xanthocarpia lactea]
MNLTRQPSAQLERFVSFYILPMLIPSQRSLLISNLVRYDQLTGVGLLSKSNLFLTTLEEDIQILHISSFTLPQTTPEQNLLLQTDYDRNVGLKLDAPSPTALRVLQEDLTILHRSSAKPPLISQANGEHGLTAKINEPYPLRNTILRPARNHSPSVEAVDVSEWPGVETVKYKSMAPAGERLSTSIKPLNNSPERGPATGYKKNLAYSNPTTHESGPKRKRPVAADFFTPDCTPRPKSSKQGMSDFSSEDITRLLQVEKAKACSATSEGIPNNLEPGKVGTKTTSRRMTDSNKMANGKRTTGDSTIAKLGPWEPKPYHRYPYRPHINNYPLWEPNPYHRYTYQPQINKYPSWEPNLYHRYTYQPQINKYPSWEPNLYHRYTYQPQINNYPSWEPNPYHRYTYQPQINKYPSWEPNLYHRYTYQPQINNYPSWEPNPYLRYTYQPQINSYLYGRRVANAVIPTWSLSPIEQPVEVGMEDMRPQPGQYSLHQGDRTTISSPITRDTAAYAYQVLTKPKAEDHRLPYLSKYRAGRWICTVPIMTGGTLGYHNSFIGQRRLIRSLDRGNDEFSKKEKGEPLAEICNGFKPSWGRGPAKEYNF